MWKDPIVKETRELREEYAAKFGHDSDAIFEDIYKRQRRTERKIVSFPARKPLSKSYPHGEAAGFREIPA